MAVIEEAVEIAVPAPLTGNAGHPIELGRVFPELVRLEPRQDDVLHCGLSINGTTDQLDIRFTDSDATHARWQGVERAHRGSAVCRPLGSGRCRIEVQLEFAPEQFRTKEQDIREALRSGLRRLRDSLEATADQRTESRPRDPLLHTGPRIPPEEPRGNPRRTTK